VARILVVEDDARVRRFVLGALRGAGHAVKAFGDAESAQAALLKSRPDLFLLDINLPGMHGLELARRLRRQKATRDLPVLVLSARRAPRDKVAAFATGAVTYLVKPCSRAALQAAVAAALERSPRRD
jgi:two-component system phosphate regulon response regulator PhoB